MRRSHSRPLLRAIAFAATLAATLAVCFVSVGARTATPQPDGSATPVLHSVTLGGEAGAHTLEVTGSSLGPSKGKVRVGGKRAKVTSWSDSVFTVKVARRTGGGPCAIEIETADGLAPRYPLPVLLPGDAPHAGRLLLRSGRRLKKYHGSSLWRVVVDPEPAAEISFGRQRRRWATRRIDRRRCYFVFGCKGRIIIRRFRAVHVSSVRVRVPIDAIESGELRLVTAADHAYPRSAFSGSWYFNKKDGSMGLQAGDDWWIVVGRDAGGAICGQFLGTSQKDRPQAGRFALGESALVPDLHLDVVRSAHTVTVGSTATYTIDVASGFATARDVVIECALPPEQVLVSADAPGLGHSVSGNVVTFDGLPVLPANTTQTYIVMVRATTPGRVNSATYLTAEAHGSPSVDHTPINQE